LLFEIRARIGGLSLPTRQAENRIGTLRRRLGAWAALALAGVIAALTAAAIVEERKLVLGLQRANGESLLSHLAAMPEFRDDYAAARRHVEMLGPALGPGVSLELAPADAIADANTLATRGLDLSDGVFELRYALDRTFLLSLARRSALVHAMHGLVALALSLAALDWILRAKLARPLRQIAHQIRFMRRGGGWEPKLPIADAEITEVADALRELGPALHDQVQGWVEAERRAGAAHALSEVRSRLREPKLRALALLGDLQARDAVSPRAKQKVRALVAEIERLAREIDAEEQRIFGALGPRQREGDAPA